jgi:CBS domain-containing protein
MAQEAKMKKVRELIQGKQQVYSVSSQDTVLHALEVLAEKGVGALLVMDGETLAGIISERDYARKVALRGKTSLETRVADIMVEDVLYPPPAGAGPWQSGRHAVDRRSGQESARGAEEHHRTAGKLHPG